MRAANELKKQSVPVSAGGIRSIWLRHRPEVKALRLKRLEKWAAENTGVLTESQVQALEAAKEEEAVHGEVESPHPGFLLAQDTCYPGYIKGEGRLYQQTAIDSHASAGFAKLYLEKTALIAADLLNDQVLPYYDQHHISILRVLTDRGAEYCGRVETHPYKLFLHLNSIEHTKIKPRRPQTNGAVKRLKQTIQDEFYQVAFRKKLYRSPEGNADGSGPVYELLQRPAHQPGKVLPGPHPSRNFRQGLGLYQQLVYENNLAETTVMR